MKLKAGALQFTMFIVVVIALLLAAIILFFHIYDRFKLQTDFVIETVENADKGISYTLKNVVPSKDTLHIESMDETNRTIKVHRDYWGLFEKVIAMSKIKMNLYKKAALIGGIRSESDRMALYLEDQNKPLVLVGNTRIQGVAYIPKQGVRTGNISGHSYYGDQLIYGSMRESGELPKISEETINAFQHLKDETTFLAQDQYLKVSDGATYKNSFFKPLQIVYSLQDIILSNVQLTGHILVQSETKIIVEASCKLTDVILMAPEILIKDFVKGTFQAIAAKTIDMGQYCTLQYPSALLLNEDNVQDELLTISNNTKTPLIKVEKGSHIKGVIAFYGQAKDQRAQIFIDEKAKVTGEVYCNRNLELLGGVDGSVITSGFVSNQSGSSYQNHIYNATISMEGLSKEYVGLLFEDSEKGIMKWLY